MFSKTSEEEGRSLWYPGRCITHCLRSKWKERERELVFVEWLHGPDFGLDICTCAYLMLATAFVAGSTDFTLQKSVIFFVGFFETEFFV